MYVVALTTLHVGGEAGLRSIEASVARLRVHRRELPYIPSTSIRGATRTAAYMAGLEAGLSVCAAREPREIGERHRRMFGDDSKVCPVCGVWGAPGLETAIHFTDLLPLDNRYATASLARVELDDYLGKVRLGALYVEEVLAPGSVFAGRLHIDTNLLQERVKRGIVGGVGDTCTLYKLVLSSLLLLPLVGLGRGGLAAAFIEDTKDTGTPAIAERVGCDPGDETLSKMLELLRWRDEALHEVLDRVFSEMSCRVELVRRALGGGTR